MRVNSKPRLIEVVEVTSNRGVENNGAEAYGEPVVSEVCQVETAEQLCSFVAARQDFNELAALLVVAEDDFSKGA